MHPSYTPTLGVSPTDQRPGKDSEAWVPDSEERLILREEFTSRMHQRFLDGKDGDFDYRCSPALPLHPLSPAPHRAGAMGSPSLGVSGQRSVGDPGVALSISEPLSLPPKEGFEWG